MNKCLAETEPLADPANNYIPDLFEDSEKSNYDRWLKFHKDNPHVWQEFERLTFRAISAGRKAYSAWVIINLIRWNYEIKTKSGDFKINNNHIAYFARLFEKVHPEYEGFFKLRKLKKP